MDMDKIEKTAPACTCSCTKGGCRCNPCTCKNCGCWGRRAASQLRRGPTSPPDSRRLDYAGQL